MAEGFPTLSENGLMEDKIVLAMVGRDFEGFLLTLATAPNPDEYRAYYVDGEIELIDPITGVPRPDPDPAVRTKFLKLPAALTPAPSTFTGQIRRIVQCYASQGRVNPYRSNYEVSHGILEYPFPRVIGATAAEERTNASLRKFWIIEISSAGVYMAPVTVGVKCLSCMTATINAYLNAGRVDLAWTFVNNNDAGLVEQLLDDTDIADAFPAGGDLATNHNTSWAFSYSGRKASNVLLKHFSDNTLVASGATLDSLIDDPSEGKFAVIASPGHGVLFNEEVRATTATGFVLKAASGQSGYDVYPPTADTITFPYDAADEAEIVAPFTIRKAAHYTASRFDIEFEVEYPTQPATIDLISAGVARVTSVNHGISEGGLVVVAGADQAEYNGAHAASSVTANTFLIGVSGSPVTPATGSIVISGTHLTPTLGATLTAHPAAQFNHMTGRTPITATSSVLWFQRSADRWDPLERTPGIYFVNPPTGSTAFTAVYPQECPLFIYYDGETPIVLTWNTGYEGSDFVFGFTAGGVDHTSIATVTTPPTAVTHSEAMLFLTEREAIGMLQATPIGATSVDTVDCQYDLWTRGAVDSEVFTLDPPGSLSVISSGGDDVISGWASGEPAVGGFIFGYQPSPLAAVAGQHYTTVTDIRAMGGGLYYEDPLLDPTDQSGNRVRVFDGAQLTEGGFAALGETYQIFIGQV